MKQQAMLRLFRNRELTEYVRSFARSNLAAEIREEGEQEAWAAIVESRFSDDHCQVARRAIWRFKKRMQKIARHECPQLSDFTPMSPREACPPDPDAMN